jgi:septal ring factor EnvC (AmiA/AmiB activator)
MASRCSEEVRLKADTTDVPVAAVPVASGFPPPPKVSARLAEARFAREGGSRTMMIAIVLLIAASPLRAQPADRARTEAMARRAGERLQSLQREADRLASEERTLLNDLRKLEVERQIKAEELKHLDAEGQKIQTELTATAERMEGLTKSEAAERPELRARLVEIYKLGEARYLRLLLSTPDVRRIGQASRTVAALAKMDRDRVVSHQHTLNELKTARATLQERQKKLATVRAGAEKAQASVQRAAQARADLIRDIDRRRDLNAQLAGELQASQQKLQLALRDFANGAPAVEVAALPFKPFRGELAWPVPGTVLRRFGRTAGPAGSASNGIEIAATDGTEALAVHDGVVAFADTFAGFGNLVILDHGSRTYSLYGDLLDITVKKGGRVQHGQPVGAVGPTPSGPTGLYFELRVDGEPVDPLQWLKKR